MIFGNSDQPPVAPATPKPTFGGMLAEALKALVAAGTSPAPRKGIGLAGNFRAKIRAKPCGHCDKK